MSFSMEVVSPEKLKSAIEEQVKPVPEEVITAQRAGSKQCLDDPRVDIESLEKRKEVLQSIDSFGMSSMKSSSEKNSLLQVSVGNLSKTGDEGGQVAKGLNRAASPAEGFGSRVQWILPRAVF